MFCVKTVVCTKRCFAQKNVLCTKTMFYIPNGFAFCFAKTGSCFVAGNGFQVMFLSIAPGFWQQEIRGSKETLAFFTGVPCFWPWLLVVFNGSLEAGLGDLLRFHLQAQVCL
jgi:hypothetical protein